MPDPQTESLWQDRTLTLDDGQVLGYSRYGNKDAFAIIYFHGLPSSRGEGQLWDLELNKLNLQMIAIDRPGMGLSTRIPKRSVNGFAAQVAQLISHLNMEAYSMLGVSGGGPYALACAAHKDLFPGLRKVGVLAGLGSRELTNSGMSVLQRLSISAMDWMPSSVFCWFWEVAIGKAARDPDPKVLEASVEGMMKAQKGEDVVWSDNRTCRAMTAALRGAFAQGSKGYFDDATAICRAWGFRLTEIEGVTVSFWYGEKDVLAPSAAGKALSDSTVGSSFTCYEGESHPVVTLKHREGILSSLQDK